MQETLSKPVSVVVPAYNEEAGVSAQVESVRTCLELAWHRARDSRRR